MKHALRLRIGPAAFRIGSRWRAPVEALDRLYAGYPRPARADFTVRLEPAGALRAWLRPSVRLGGDFMLPDAAPLPLAHGLLAAEMAMNLQLALGWRRHLLLHAACLERDGRALVLTGESGAGKSTLAALLSLHGWRLMGDEFALLDLHDGRVHAFPRLVSLKNESVAELAARVAPERLGPLLEGTPKGDIRHLVPDAAAVAAMDVPATPALLLFPRFGAAAATRPVEAGEAFVRLTQASTTYATLGEPGFRALTRFVDAVPRMAIDYPDSAAALALVDRLWNAR